MIYLLQVTPPPIIDWGEVGAAAINSVVVLIAVQAIKHFLPILRQKYPWAIPLIAVVAGPGIAYVTSYLFTVLGHPVDLGPILGALTGTAAVAMNQIGKQARK
jgi:CHASE2 domain-containing sensor protein